jgi:hypothetical protein
MHAMLSRTQISRCQGAAFGACLIASLSAAAAVAEPAAAKASAAGGEQAPLRAAHRATPGDAQTAMDLGLRLFQKDRTSLEAQRLLETASRHFPHRHDVHLKLLGSHLARHEATAATALLARLQPELDAST